MRTVEKTATTEIVEMGAYVAPGFPPCSEFYAYAGDKLIRVCPSLGMAREVLAGY
jgi:hypothetical protein